MAAACCNCSLRPIGASSQGFGSTHLARTFSQKMQAATAPLPLPRAFWNKLSATSEFALAAAVSSSCLIPFFQCWFGDANHPRNVVMRDAIARHRLDLLAILLARLVQFSLTYAASYPGLPFGSCEKSNGLAHICAQPSEC